MTVFQLGNNSEISRAIWNIIEDACKRNSAENDQTEKLVHIAISGGSLSKIIASDSSIISSVMNSSFIHRIHWFWADERCVPLDHEDSNYKSCVELFTTLGIREENIHTINPSLIGDPKAAASDYAQIIKKYVMGEKFDLVLLGMGPDGHTASLFPNHSLLSVKDTSVASILDSPKPPGARISLTLPCLNNSKCVTFAATGPSKAKILQEIFDGKNSYPASMVDPRPNGGRLYWLLDGDAAKDLVLKPKQIFAL